MSGYTLSTVLTFGKYQGLSVEAISRFDALYLLWLKRNVDSFVLDPAALEYCKTAWTREYNEQAERQNAWAWGFGAGAKKAAHSATARRIRLEHEERRKAGLQVPA